MLIMERLHPAVANQPTNQGSLKNIVIYRFKKSALILS